MRSVLFLPLLGLADIFFYKSGGGFNRSFLLINGALVGCALVAEAIVWVFAPPALDDDDHTEDDTE